LEGCNLFVTAFRKAASNSLTSGRLYQQQSTPAECRTRLGLQTNAGKGRASRDDRILGTFEFRRETLSIHTLRHPRSPGF
jgi:hypothetical protein